VDQSYLLISDVDGTILGDDQALIALAEWLAPRREQVRLVYNSGRFFDSVVASVHATAMPFPDAVIGGVGTQIRAYPDGEPIGDWLQQVPHWSTEIIQQVCHQFPQLELQPSEQLSEHKISYFAYDAEAELLDAIEQELIGHGCQVQMVYSSQRDLDFLPQHVNKGTASAFLASHWNTPVDRVVVSGDSGNDLALFQHRFRGVVVGNSHPELKALNGDSVYQAAGTHAAGVLQGWRHWLGD